MILRLWHGPRLHKWLVSKVRVQRTGARWRAQLRGVSEMFKPCSRESERQKRRASEKRASAPLARRFKQTNFRHRPQAAGPIRASVRGGAPPARLFFLQGIFM